MEPDRRRALLYAALSFARLQVEPAAPPELVTLQRWIGSWAGIGAVITGMLRQGFDVDLRSHEHRLHDRGWRATFLHRDHVNRPWVGQVIRFYSTPGEAIREGAWEALKRVPPHRDLSRVEESPR